MKLGMSNTLPENPSVFSLDNKSRSVIDSRQVNAPKSQAMSIVTSIKQTYRCDRIDNIYPQMPLHLGVKFYRVLRLSAVSTRKNSWAIGGPTNHRRFTLYYGS